MFGRRSQQDFEDEIQSHIQMEVERLKSQGMSAADAMRQARRTFDAFSNPLQSVLENFPLRHLLHVLLALLAAPNGNDRSLPHRGFILLDMPGFDKPY